MAALTWRTEAENILANERYTNIENVVRSEDEYREGEKMGITKSHIQRIIADFNKRGLRPFGKLLTLSRYDIGFDKAMLNHILKNEGWNISIDDADERNELLNNEIVFKTLGFEHLDAMDNSEYEFANIIHDLNDTNVPDELKDKYDFIVDAGTIEHVFHFPNVLENIYKLLKVGGTFYFHQPSKYTLNHGYYFFQPCVYYEYFKANNYEINSFALYAESIDHSFAYAAADIDSNEICDIMPAFENWHHMCFGSVTKTHQSTFDVIPNQGRYSRRWKSNHPLKIILDTFKNFDNIYLYGTGITSRNLLQRLPIKYRDKVRGLISRDVEEIGTKFYGYEIVDLEGIETGGGGV